MLTYDALTDTFTPAAELEIAQADAARNAVAHARVTGSVSCTYDGVSALRCYVVRGGHRAATDLWLIELPAESPAAALSRRVDDELYPEGGE